MITLSGDKLVITVHGDQQERKLMRAEAVLSAYRDQFGSPFAEVPELRRGFRNGW